MCNCTWWMRLRSAIADLRRQTRNPYSRWWLWIPGSRFARPGMTKLKNFPVLDESEIVGHLVVKHPRLRIARLRQPIDPAGTGRPGLAVDFLDQCAPQSMATHIFRHV